uniref:DUF4220 domain-containing protein n=1 Tax=Hordeum vulgare subsp. vulgare TaxID=112509 RepID=A0A8I6Y8P2_HORVV
MYRVVEVELGFLFDFFYTRYPQPKQSLIPETAILVSSVSLSLATLLSPALLHYNNRSMANSGFVTTVLDIWLARFVIVLFVILELFQYMSLVLSDWHKVKMMCRYVRRCKPRASSWWPVLERLPLLLCRATLTRSYWSNSVGQYSLLHACLDDERSWLARVPMHRWIKDQLSRIRTVTRPNLPLSVKRAIHHFLRSEWLSYLKYGDRTLQRHAMMHDFDWCTSRYQHGAVGSILVWHIATTVYQRLSSSQQEEKQQQEKQQLDGNREVAITLSNYCAYLLFQAPELVTDQMTDQIYERRRLTEALKLRVHQFIKRKGCRSKNDMFHKLAKYESREVPAEAGGYEEDILDDGIRLGYQIFEEMPGEDGARWKVLSEMWVELMLSIAPSDNAMVHVKKLATGGELITHVWALMTHAGIIHRPEKPCYDS